MTETYGINNIYLRPRGAHFLEAMTLGWENCRPGHDYGPAIRDYYLIHYVVSGSGMFKNDRGEYTVTAGQSFVIRPGEVTYYRASNADPWSYIWVGFIGETAKIFDGSSDVIITDLGEYFDGMKKSADYEYMREEMVVGQLYLMIAELFGKKGDARPRSVGFAERTANYIEFHYMQPISVEAMAREQNIDRRYLSRLFKREYGMGIQDYIISQRMKHAKRFLCDGYSVSQTAEMVGYADIFNFSKMFKRYFGISPSRCRRESCDDCK